MDTDQSDILRKKICITEYHNKLLNEIVEKRHVSRSEAVRAAIQHQAQYLSDSEDTNIESLQTELKQIAKEIGTIHEKIEEQNSSVVRVTEQVPDSTENGAKSEIKPETEKEIVSELVKSGPLSIDEIVERIGEDVISVIPATKSLRQEGIICPVSNNVDKYEINR